MTAERLQKILSRAGVTSRRKAEALIAQGRVSVNGKVVRELGARAVFGKDDIRVNGKPVATGAERVVLALFKPRYCVTTLHDPQGRRTVADFISNLPWRVYPVGRLDYDAEGLLLFTNDGELAHRLQHPRYQTAKVYQVKVKGEPDEEALKRLQQGIPLEEGVTSPAEVSVLETGARTTRLSISVREGRYHQVKRMCEAVGHPVRRLRRVQIGPVTLGDMQPGSQRRLNSKEVKALREAVGLEARRKARASQARRARGSR